MLINYKYHAAQHWRHDYIIRRWDCECLHGTKCYAIPCRCVLGTWIWMLELCSLAETQISGGSSVSCGHQPRLAQQFALLLAYSLERNFICLCTSSTSPPTLVLTWGASKSRNEMEATPIINLTCAVSLPNVSDINNPCGTEWGLAHESQTLFPTYTRHVCVTYMYTMGLPDTYKYTYTQRNQKIRVHSQSVHASTCTSV